MAAPRNSGLQAAFNTLVTLVGRLAAKTKVFDEFKLSPEERDIVDNAIREYEFYHAHERTAEKQVPSGTGSSEAGDSGQSAVKRKGR